MSSKHFLGSDEQVGQLSNNASAGEYKLRREFLFIYLIIYLFIVIYYIYLFLFIYLFIILVVFHFQN